jgi:histidinol-phosphate aminotransferase
MNRGLADIKPYVGGKHKREAQDKYRVAQPVKLSSNENPLGVSPRALEHARAILSEANLYPDGSNSDLRERIAEQCGIGPESVVFGNGADEIIYYLAMSLLNDGDEVIIPRLTFPIYEIACRTMRADIVYSDMDGLKIDAADILRRITPNTKLIALCNPNNPTGHALQRDEVYGLMERVPQDVLIIADEAYSDFADRESFPDSIARFRDGVSNIFIIKTLSKAYGIAGFRVGYGIGDAGIVELIHRIKLPFNVSIVSQHAALGALDDDAFIEETLRNTREGREAIYRAMDELSLSYMPSSTNFVLIDTGRDADQVTEELMARGVIVRSARNYGLPNSIRVTVGTAEQNQCFLDAMKGLFS